VGLAAASGAGFAALTFGPSEATAQTSGVTADDISIESGAGKVTELYVDPRFEVTWSNAEKDVYRVEASISVRLASESNFIEMKIKGVGVSSPGASGSKRINLGSAPLLGGGRLDPSTFEDTTEDGSPEQTDVVLKVSITFEDSDKDELSLSTSEQDTFTVSVNNVESTATVGGSWNTDGS
jgi:hypothetical protein